MIKKYRKKPVVVEAMQLTHQNIYIVASWVNENGNFAKVGILRMPGAVPELHIKTLEGMMYCDFGSWVIKGVQGEFYPCKDSIFQATYEEVSDEH